MATAVTARVATRRPRSEQSGRIFAPLIIPFLILAAIAVYQAVAPYAKTNVPPPGARGSLVWGGAIFANEKELRAWLRLRGVSYPAFAKDHPAAVWLVRPHRHRAVPAKAHRKPHTARKAATAATVTTTTQHHGIEIWFVVGLGLLFGLLALMPHRLAERLGIHVGSRERELRVAAIGAGSALLLGVIAATLLS
jgi:hypothetical protein